MPYVAKDKQRNTRTWWGDRQATIDYCKINLPRICKQFGGDPKSVFVCGFSRGAIGASYIGLADDEIAALWKGVFACGGANGFLQQHGDLADFTFLNPPITEIFDIPDGKVIHPHTDLWMHRDSEYRRQVRKWFSDHR